MTIEILPPDESLFQGEATHVSLPGSDGRLGILDNHAPLITTLQAGDVVLRTATGNQSFAVSGGTVEVASNKVTILAS